MAERLSPESKNSMIQGLHECFAVDKNVIQAVLDSQNWNIEKCLSLLESISPKVNNSKKQKNNSVSKGKINESNPNKVKANAKTGNVSDKIGLISVNKASSSFLAGSSDNEKGKKKQNIKVASETLKIGGDEVSWDNAVTGTNPPIGINKKGKASLKNISEPGERFPVAEPTEEKKKRKRNIIKSAYEIIKQKTNSIDRIGDCIKCNIRVIILMRGCPGSGKSTYARTLLSKNGISFPEEHIFSSDNYFMDINGCYNYNKYDIDKAHNWNQNLVEKVMKIGLSPVIVDNTNVKAWEMSTYAQFAIRLGYVVELLEPPTSWFSNSLVLAKKNSHGVPKDKISMMLQNYEQISSSNHLLQRLNLSYNLQQAPPQHVNYPRDAVISAINKAMVGKRLPISNPKKITNLQSTTGKLKNNILVDNSDCEIIKCIPSTMLNVNKLAQSKYVEKNVDNSVLNKSLSPAGFKTDFFSEKGFLRDSKNNSVLSTTETSWSKQDLPGSSSSNLTPFDYPNFLSSELDNVNLIDKPIEEDLGSSLIDPLAPELRINHVKNIKCSSKPDVISFDPSEFPSITSSSSASHKTIAKMKKLTELFPHLDKEYIKDLCNNSKIELDDIVSIVLDSNDINLDQSQESCLNQTNSIEGGSSSESTSEEDQEETGTSNSDKDIAMLVQLFPNIEVHQIHITYRKYQNDFRNTLEYFLNDNNAKEDSNITDREEVEIAKLSDSDILNQYEACSMKESHGDKWKDLFSSEGKPLRENILFDSVGGYTSVNNYIRQPVLIKTTNSEADENIVTNKNLSSEINDASINNTDKHLIEVSSLKNKSYENSSNVNNGKSFCRFVCVFDDNCSDIIDNSAMNDNISNVTDFSLCDEENSGAENKESSAEVNVNVCVNSNVTTFTSRNEHFIYREDSELINTGLVSNVVKNNTSDKHSSVTLTEFDNALKDVLSNVEKVKTAGPSCSGVENLLKGNTFITEKSIDLESSGLFDWSFDFNSKKKRNEQTDDTTPKDQRDIFGSINPKFQNSSSNTNYKDFELLKKAQSPSEIIPVKVLVSTPNFISSTRTFDSTYDRKSKLTLDKGTSTMEVEPNFSEIDNNNKGAVLASMFPFIPQDDLDSLLKSCVGDLNWTVGLLLDSGHEVSSDFDPSTVQNLHISNNEIISDQQNETSEDITYDNLPSLMSNSQNVSKNKKIKPHRTPVNSIHFVMNDDSMSKHTKKIRNARLGIEERIENCFDINNEITSSSSYFADNSYYPEEEIDEEDDETLAVALSTDLILGLQAQFGGYLPNVLPDNKVLVHLPVYLARQLHSCIMDSISIQLTEEQKLIDKMIEEDESLARQLQDLENGDTLKPLSFQEIMDEELALNIHKSLNQGKSDKETMAGKLARQLLIERFPTMDPVGLQSILDDTDYSLYQATHLLEAAGYQRASPTTDVESVSTAASSNNELSREEAVEQAGVYREAAQTFFQMRHDCFTKAQKAYSEGNKHVASYYSQMANWHSQRIEQANLLASTMLLNGNKDATTLDLHFLRVREAVQVLDLFIDAHVTNLKELNMNKREAYVVTGRGLHSHDGKSKIRPAAITRLKQRSVAYQLINPGLLLIHLTSKTPLTYQKNG